MADWHIEVHDGDVGFAAACIGVVTCVVQVDVHEYIPFHSTMVLHNAVVAAVPAVGSDLAVGPVVAGAHTAAAVEMMVEVAADTDVGTDFVADDLHSPVVVVVVVVSLRRIAADPSYLVMAVTVAVATAAVVAVATPVDNLVVVEYSLSVRRGEIEYGHS